MIAFIVFAHGSSVESANDAVRAVANEAARRAGWALFETAFLGGGSPSLPDAARNLASAGANEIVVIPYFLTSGLQPAMLPPKETATTMGCKHSSRKDSVVG